MARALGHRAGQGLRCLVRDATGFDPEVDRTCLAVVTRKASGGWSAQTMCSTLGIAVAPPDGSAVWLRMTSDRSQVNCKECLVLPEHSSEDGELEVRLFGSLVNMEQFQVGVPRAEGC